MSTFDVESLLAPIEGESPCGPDRAYDPDYVELERSAEEAPEQQVGEAVIAAVEPDWRDVGERSIDLLRRTKNLRVMMLLTVARLQTHGLEGLYDALRLLRESLEQYWDHLHPQLDPDDNNDPLERMNVVGSLAPRAGIADDPLQIVRRVREAPLTDSQVVGRFSLLDVAVANGDLPPPVPAEGEVPGQIPDPAMIAAAFDDTGIDWLVATAEAAEGAREELKRVDQFLTETVGAATAPQLAELEKAISEAVSVLRTHLSRRGVGEPDEAPGEREEAAGDGHGISGEIRSREDVLLALDKVCRYYEAHEPSSPVPLLIRRAQKLVAKSFVEIVADLTPGAMSDIETIGGQSYSSE